MPDAGLPGKYTVSLSVYLTDQNRRDGILFQLSDFRVKIIYERGCMTPKLIIHPEGEPEINIPRSFMRNQWINMTFAFDGFLSGTPFPRTRLPISCKIRPAYFMEIFYTSVISAAENFWKAAAIPI